jgi:hypothetical protein
MNDNSKIEIAGAFKHLGLGRKLGANIISGFTWIGMKGKVFSLHHQGEKMPFLLNGHPSPYLDVVIVGENPNNSRIYYEGVYSDNSANPPDCASINGSVPDAHVPKQQAKYCGDCKWSRYNSAPNGGRGKACQEHKRIAVVIMPAMLKGILDKPFTEPVFFKIPPDSLKSWKSYGESLYHRGAPFFAVVTRITFDPKEQFRLLFTVKQPLSDKEAPVVLPLLESPQTLNIIGGAFAETQDVTPALPEPVEETGLLEAFGQASEEADEAEIVEEVEEEAPQKAVRPVRSTKPVTEVKRRGRPPGSGNKAKIVETTASALDEDEETTDEDGEEASAGLSDRIADLLKNKTSNMMK